MAGGKWKGTKGIATPSTPMKLTKDRIRECNHRHQAPQSLHGELLSDSETRPAPEHQLGDMASMIDILLDIHSRLDAQQKEYKI